MSRARFAPMLVLALAASSAAANDFEPLFDGESLSGWKNPFDWGKATVEDGEIHLKASKKFFLVSKKTYGDFIFEAEVKVPDTESNSGLQFRSHVEKNKVWGYQAEVDPSDRQWAGGLYDEGRRGWINPLKDQPKAQKAFDPGGWNKYRIKCVGDHIQIWVNGTRTTDVRDPKDLAGHFALQHHGEKGKVYRFRNIRVKDLGRHTWKPQFNGKNLDGWHALPGGEWKVKDGVLVGTSPSSESRHAILVSDATHSDFTVRVVYKAMKGNSGFYFRAKPVDSAVNLHGFQAEISADGDNAAGLYETGGRGWVVQPPEDRIKDAFKPKAWNTMVVSAHGNRIVTHLNGTKMVSIDDKESRSKGVFGLQLHGGQTMDVRFKAIELLRPAQ